MLMLKQFGGYAKSGNMFFSKVATYYAPNWSLRFA